MFTIFEKLLAVCLLFIYLEDYNPDPWPIFYGNVRSLSASIIYAGPESKHLDDVTEEEPEDQDQVQDVVADIHHADSHDQASMKMLSYSETEFSCTSVQGVCFVG